MWEAAEWNSMVAKFKLHSGLAYQTECFDQFYRYFLLGNFIQPKVISVSLQHESVSWTKALLSDGNENEYASFKY